MAEFTIEKALATIDARIEALRQEKAAKEQEIRQMIARELREYDRTIQELMVLKSQFTGEPVAAIKGIRTASQVPPSSCDIQQGDVVMSPKTGSPVDTNTGLLKKALRKVG